MFLLGSYGTDIIIEGYYNRTGLVVWLKIDGYGIKKYTITWSGCLGLMVWSQIIYCPGVLTIEYSLVY